MIRWKQQVGCFPDFGMTFGNPDFAAYARAHYAKGSRVQTADGLVPALEAAFREGGVHLIAAPIDYTENIRVLVDELRNAALDSQAEKAMIKVIQTCGRLSKGTCRSPQCAAS